MFSTIRSMTRAIVAMICLMLIPVLMVSCVPTAHGAPATAPAAARTCYISAVTSTSRPNAGAVWQLSTSCGTFYHSRSAMSTNNSFRVGNASLNVTGRGIFTVYTLTQPNKSARVYAW
jgi:hypothetical protein